MERFSDSVSDIVKKYLPKFREASITFDLDFPDTTINIEDKDRVKKDIEKGLKSSISRTKNGRIKLTIKKGEISITDTGTVIDKTTCKNMTTEHFKVKSRVGFGTTFTINLAKRQD